MRNDLPGENWRPLPDWEGCYEVSDLGRVYSVRRPKATKSGRIMSPARHPHGYLYVQLRQDGRVAKGYIHRLVAAAFIGPCPEGMEVRHLDGDPTNSHPSNLAYGTHVENEQDKLRHGTHQWASRTECINGHAWDELNTRVGADGRRHCRPCRNARNRAYRIRQALKSAGYGPDTDAAA